MLLYGYRIQQEPEYHTLYDISTSVYPTTFYSFGFEDSITVVDDDYYDIFGINCLHYIDYYELTTDEDTSRLLAVTNNKYAAIQGFEATNSWYAKPALVELSTIHFINVQPNDFIKFYYVTLGGDNTSHNFFPYPIVYDEVSQKEYVISGKTFTNTTDYHVVVRTLCHATSDIVLEYDDSIVTFVNGIQSNVIPQGVNRVDFYLDPQTTIDFPDVSWLPLDCYTSYPTKDNKQVFIGGNTIGRLLLPCHFDFVRVYINEAEVPSLRVGHLVYFELDTIPDSIVVQPERPTKLLPFDTIISADTIIDLEYVTETNTLSISGIEIPLSEIDYQIDEVSRTILITLNLENYQISPFIGDYITINIDDNQRMFVITRIDTTDLANTKIYGDEI